MQLFQNESSRPKTNAQRNLCGRTHYVDDDTLRWHKSRVLSARCTDHGLLFAIVTSDALDMNNTKRGFRYVIFDVFGTTLDRPDLEHAFKSHAQASKAMWVALNAIDAYQVTRDAIANAERAYARETAQLRLTVDALEQKNKAA